MLSILSTHQLSLSPSLSLCFCCLHGQPFRDRLTQALVVSYVCEKTDRMGVCPRARLTHEHGVTGWSPASQNVEQLPLGCHPLMGLNCFNPSQGQHCGSLALLFLKVCVICRPCVSRRGKVLLLLFWDDFPISVDVDTAKVLLSNGTKPLICHLYKRAYISMHIICNGNNRV